MDLKKTDLKKIKFTVLSPLTGVGEPTETLSILAVFYISYVFFLGGGGGVFFFFFGGGRFVCFVLFYFYLFCFCLLFVFLFYLCLCFSLLN
jgi:hypothetical protein